MKEKSSRMIRSAFSMAMITRGSVHMYFCDILFLRKASYPTNCPRKGKEMDRETRRILMSLGEK